MAREWNREKERRGVGGNLTTIQEVPENHSRGRTEAPFHFHEQNVWCCPWWGSLPKSNIRP
jgi:hypothetical protein